MAATFSENRQLVDCISESAGPSQAQGHTAIMPKNIVICCDGTGNQIGENLSNVLKLFRILKKSEAQVIYYDPGVGTLGQSDPWARIKENTRLVLGLATGAGLDDDVLQAYEFLADRYETGDHIFLFGFSRGAYTVRVLAGFLYLVGLLRSEQKNISGYALTAYKRASEEDELEIAWQFKRVTGARVVPIKFIGVWDTVSSLLVPRPDRFYIPAIRTLPYTRQNPSVEVFRQAIAIDERRRMFRLNRWSDPQSFQPDRFDQEHPAVPQDIKQVWFAGVHADIGGGYPEIESALSKFPLLWMIEEATAHGLEIETWQLDHLAKGIDGAPGRFDFVAPDPNGKLHNSMTLAWRLLEYIPKRTKWREWPKRKGLAGYYLPRSEPRLIPEGALIHQSVSERIKNGNYDPPNLPGNFTLVT